MQLQQTQANVSVYETKGQNNKVNIPIIPTITTSQAPGLNENITSKSAKTPLNFSLQNVNTPSFVPQVVNQSATRAEPGQYNTQLWPIQEENADIQKLQVELLWRMTVSVPKPPVFNGNILEYLKWQNAFNTLIEDQVVSPNYKLYYLGEYTRNCAKIYHWPTRAADRGCLQESEKTLKEHFRDPFRIYEAYRDRLRNWLPCASITELLEFSGFLVMMQETMKSVKYLKELKSYSTIREFVPRLPTYYSNKWRGNAKE